MTEEEELKIFLDSVEPPEPEIVYEGFFGEVWYPSQSAFEKDYIQKKDGRWRKRRRKERI